MWRDSRLEAGEAKYLRSKASFDYSDRDILRCGVAFCLLGCATSCYWRVENFGILHRLVEHLKTADCIYLIIDLIYWPINFASFMQSCQIFILICALNLGKSFISTLYLLVKTLAKM